jgi:hypothetical protein
VNAAVKLLKRHVHRRRMMYIIIIINVNDELKNAEGLVGGPNTNHQSLGALHSPFIFTENKSVIH